MYSSMYSPIIGIRGVCEWEGSEFEKIDKVLRGEGHGAAFWVVGCAGVVYILKEKKETLHEFIMPFPPLCFKNKNILVSHLH